MASVNLQNFLQCNPDFAATARRLYGADCDTQQVAERYIALAAVHRSEFGHTTGSYFSSPGRIELCGNHTDHQNGQVLAAAITLDTLALVTPTDTGLIRIKSGNYPLLQVDAAHTDYDEKEAGTSLALVKGVCRYLIDHDCRLGGFDCTMTSNVTRGAGVSSSASFECCVAEIINVLYNSGRISAIDKAKASQWAESRYFGKPCGLLDQSAIALGGVAYIDFIDPEQPKVRKLDWTIPDCIVLVNSGGDHCKLTDCYTAIRDEMTQVAHALGGKVLRDVQPSPMLVPICRKAGIGGRAIMRALHFWQENERVLNATTGLITADAATFRDALEMSGFSSMCYLQNTFVPGDDQQPIPMALEFARGLGATCARVHGGGFAGTILALYDKRDYEQAIDALSHEYGADNVFAVSTRPDGAVYTGLDYKEAL